MEQEPEGKENVEVTFSWYGHEGYGFKLVMQTFIYKIIAEKNYRGFEFKFNVIRSTIQVEKEKLNLI